MCRVETSQAGGASGGQRAGVRRASPSPPPPPPRSWLGPGRRRPWKGAAASRPPHDARRVRGTDDAPGNTVTNSKHLADLLELDLAAIVHDLGLDDGRKLRRGRRILLGRCARAGGTGEIQVSGTLARSPKLVRGRFGGGAQGGESGRRSEALQAPPPSHSASAVAQVWRRSAHQQKVSSEGRGRRQQRRGGTRPASCEQLVRWPTLKSLRKPRSGRLASASARSSRPRRLEHPGVLRERCRLQNGGCGSAFHAPLFSNSKARNKTTPQLTTAAWQCFVR